jgi:hypothetical protein
MIFKGRHAKKRLQVREVKLHFMIGVEGRKVKGNRFLDNAGTHNE